MTSSEDVISILAGIVRRGHPDKKHAIPLYQYVKRHHVSRGTFLRSVSRAMLVSNESGNGTVTLIQVVIPRTRRYAYCAALLKKFEFWKKSYPSTRLVEVASVADMVERGLTGGTSWPYVISVCDFPHSQVDLDYTFGALIVQRQIFMPVVWGYTNNKYTDSSTSAEMTNYRLRHSQRLHVTRQHYQSSVMPLQLARINQRSRQLSDGVSGPLPAVSGPLPAAYTGVAPRGNQTQGLLRTVATESPIQGSVPAQDNGPSESPATRMCLCCCEEKTMHVLDCGHVCCEACINASFAATQRRLCHMCRREWTFHRPVDIGSVLPNVVCDVCKKPRVYVMVCGHAACGCPDTVCAKCNTGPRVQVFLL